MQKIGKRILSKISNKIIKKYDIGLQHTEVEVGSGSMPLEKLSSRALVFRDGMKPNELSREFRKASIPILGYISGSNFYIDLKAIPPYQEKILCQVLQEVLK